MFTQEFSKTTDINNIIICVSGKTQNQFVPTDRWRWIADSGESYWSQKRQLS